MTREIVETLKRVLKARSMTYADLAAALRVSTPTVKRLFSQRTFTLERLEEILRVLEMDFYELARMSHGRRSGPVELASTKFPIVRSASPSIGSHWSCSASRFWTSRNCTSAEIAAVMSRTCISIPPGGTRGAWFARPCG